MLIEYLLNELINKCIQISSINLSLCKDEKGLIGNEQAYPKCLPVFEVM